MGMKLFRGRLFHTPRDPFALDSLGTVAPLPGAAMPGAAAPDALAQHLSSSPVSSQGAEALESWEDGALAVEEGRILAVGDYAELRRRFPEAEVVGRQGDLLLPGFVDTHVHFPQVAAIGGMGMPLLEWLERRALPEEARLADPLYARRVAREFLRGLLRCGTTAALVFGAHHFEAQRIFFEEAAKTGLGIASGLVLSDRGLLPELHTTPERAYEESARLIADWHGRGRLRYAVTPRFAVSASDGILEAAGALARKHQGVLVQTHLNETQEEIRLVAQLFPGARDYLDVYDRHGLVGERSVFAHNLHVTGRELARLAECRASVAHCPSSNCFLGSGLFPMAAHRKQGVRFALGSDVGGGTGFSLFKEGLMAYQAQMLHEQGYPLTPVHLLYLATKAGAAALGIEHEVGDFKKGKRADFMVVRPAEDSTLRVVLERAGSPQEVLAALFTLGGEENIVEVYLAGEQAYCRGDGGQPPRYVV